MVPRARYICPVDQIRVIIARQRVRQLDDNDDVRRGRVLSAARRLCKRGIEHGATARCDEANFDRALREFEKAVGSQWVFTSDADVALYRDAYSPFQGEPEERPASAAVAPYKRRRGAGGRAHREQLPDSALHDLDRQELGLRRLGAEPAPAASCSILKRMNRMLEVSEKNAYALVEPGVSYFDLYRYIQEHKLKVWIDCPDPGWGSLIGNALDRGGGYTTTQFRNHFDAHCGMEVVLRERRAAAHRHGRDAEREDVAAVQVRLRAR